MATGSLLEDALAREKLVSLPSLSTALSLLPQARNMDDVSLHPTMYTHCAVESEEKVRPLSHHRSML